MLFRNYYLLFTIFFVIFSGKNTPLVFHSGTGMSCYPCTLHSIITVSDVCLKHHLMLCHSHFLTRM